MTGIAPITRKHYFGIFILSFAMLAYQIVLMRLFSVVLYYHFAIAGVTLAMLGLTLGAARVFSKREKSAPETFNDRWAKAALGYAISSVALSVFFLYLPNIASLNFIKIFPILFAIPFTYGSICVTLILTQSGLGAAKLYAADLCGAALGCIAVVALLFYVEPLTIILLLAALAALAAGILAAGHRLTRIAKLLTIVFFASALAQGYLYVTDGDYYRIGANDVKAGISFERWNAFSRIKTIPADTRQPYGWGFGKTPHQLIDQYFLVIDSGSNAVLTRFNGDKATVAYLADDVVNLGYDIRPVTTTLVLGAGGGRDLLAAIYYGVSKVTALELNPAIIEALTGKFADFTGNLHKRPDVELITAEARSWLGETTRKFDLVQISMINTWAATAAGGLSLAEHKLFTVEAWNEFLHALTPKGILVASRWYNPGKHHTHEFYRLLSLAVETLKQNGITDTQLKNHIIAYTGGNIAAVAVSIAPFTQEDIDHVRQTALQKGFRPLATADYSLDTISQTIIAGKADAAFLSKLSVDVSAPTDDHPFFFYTARFSDFFTQYFMLGSEIDAYHRQDMQIVFILLVLTAAFLLATIFKPMLSRKASIPLTANLPYIGYFACIGLGFMLVEISQMQRLMILLGHPVYGLSVVLFSLLLMSGLGSLSLRGKISASHAIMLCCMLSATGIATSTLIPYVKHFGVEWRIVTSVLLLAPAAFFMGKMFPAGLRLTQGVAAYQPWFWAINGAASVFASALGMAISLAYGISATYWSGVACYLLCIPLTLQLMRQAHDQPPP